MAQLQFSGGNFEQGYGVMFILAVGMLARAAVGPAERLLNMLGERKQCAGVYAIAFADPSEGMAKSYG